jgi:hypothetical protein
MLIDDALDHRQANAHPARASGEESIEQSGARFR